MPRINSISLWYTGFILTSGLSLILSVLLFTSVSDSRFSWLLLMGIALALELGKILSIHDHRRLISGLLIAVSVMGSAGGLSRAIAVTDAGVDSQQQQRMLLTVQVNQTRRTIDQNNQAIERYIELDRIRGDALPLQQQNRELERQLINQQQQLQELETVDIPELTAVLNLFATLLAMPVEWISAGVVLLLAGLLDALTVSFVRGGVLSPIREDDGQPTPPEKLPLPEPEVMVEAVQPEMTFTPAPANVTAMDDSYPAFKRMMLARRDAGQEVLSQRACIREMKLKDRVVRGFFQRLAAERVIEKGIRGQFVFAKKELRQASFSVV